MGLVVHCSAKQQSVSIYLLIHYYLPSEVWLYFDLKQKFRHSDLRPASGCGGVCWRRGCRGPAVSCCPGCCSHWI